MKQELALSKPQVYLFRSFFFIFICAAFIFFLSKTLLAAFLQTPLLNSLILFVLVLGIFLCLKRIFDLFPETEWLNDFLHGGNPSSKQTQLLTPLVKLFQGHEGRTKPYLSPVSMNSLLDIVANKLEDSRHVAKYLAAVSIFLGLLGTFWGLLQTIHSISFVINDLSVTDDALAVFDHLKQDLSEPLKGMGTAFSSSLLGLGTALILGFLDLQASQAQTHFYNQLEEKLSDMTRLTGGAWNADGDQPIFAFLQALLEQTADSLDQLQKTLQKGEQNQANVMHHMTVMAEKLERVTDQAEKKIEIMAQLVKNSQDLHPVLSDLVSASKNGFGLDDKTREHIKSTDHQLTKLVKSLNDGQEKMITEFRDEIRLLSKTITVARSKTDKA